MQVLVICRPVTGADQERFSRLLADELASLRRLQADGKLTQAWSPGHPGAVLMLEVPAAADAAELMATLPLAAEGLITTEIISLSPLELCRG